MGPVKELRIYGGSWSALLDSNATSFGFHLNPGGIGFDVNLVGSVTASAQGSITWAANPFCVQLNSDHWDANGGGTFKGRMKLSLDVSLESHSDGWYIVVGRQVMAGSSGPIAASADVSADIGLNSGGPINSDILQFIANWWIKNNIQDKVNKDLQQRIDAANQQIRSILGPDGQPLLPLQYKLPSVDDPQVQKALGKALDIPILGGFLKDHFQEIIFYLLTDDREALQQLLSAGPACEATKLLRANMSMPNLYTTVSGSCVPVQLSQVDQGLDQGHYYSDALCTNEIPFRPRPYSEFCADVLTTKPNIRLGNAAMWGADTGQVSDPLPSVPSQKWTLSNGSQFAITTEPISGKAIPFMKRVLYRDLLIPNLAARYFGCKVVIDTCAPTISDNPAELSNPVLIGYVKSAPDAGTVPRYFGCRIVIDTCVLSITENPADLSNPVLVGYVYPTQVLGTVPRYYGCAYDPVGGACSPTISDNSANLTDSYLVGYVYPARDTAKCSLEMRVYKKDVNATGLVPLLAIHGGSWRYRGGGFIGLEAQISHFTDQGYVVFAPFYRLTGAADGNPECNNAHWDDLTADAEAALDWVKQNGSAFGAAPIKPVLMGQSAGAHLSGWLVTHRSSDVAAGILLYAPSDFEDMLSNAPPHSTLYTGFEPSLSILGNYLGVDVTTIDISNPPDYIRQNSFDDLVRNAVGPVPPVFLLHGLADTIVPSNQSVLLCNAYGGTATNNGGGDQRRMIYSCGPSGGQLHLFQQGQHGLDGCLDTSVEGLCLAGDDQSRTLVADSLRQARAWLRSVANPPPPMVNAGPAQTVRGNATVVLTGSAGPSGTIVSYAWQQTAGTAVTLSGSNTASATFVAPVVSVDTVLTFRLTATDDVGHSGSASVNITVRPNLAPTANAGTNKTVNGNTLATLNGSGSDSDGSVVAYSWTQVSGPAVTLSGANTATATFTVPKVTATTSLVFRLTVTDNEGATGSATVTISAVVPPPVPVSNLSPRYIGCAYDPLGGGCIPATSSNAGNLSNAAFVGYVKATQESGTAPRYIGCGYDPFGGSCPPATSANAGDLGNPTFFGYVKTGQELGTAPRYIGCGYDPLGGSCIPAMSANPAELSNPSFVGYVYPTTTAPAY